MKKYMIFSVFLAVGTLFLFGCSNNQENEVEGENEHTNQSSEQVNAEENETNNEEETDDAEFDIDMFIEEVTKVNQELESFSIESIIDTTQIFDGEKNHSIST